MTKLNPLSCLDRGFSLYSCAMTNSKQRVQVTCPRCGFVGLVRKEYVKTGRLPKHKCMLDAGVPDWFRRRVATSAYRDKSIPIDDLVTQLWAFVSPMNPSTRLERIDTARPLNAGNVRKPEPPMVEVLRALWK